MTLDALLQVRDWGFDTGVLESRVLESRVAHVQLLKSCLHSTSRLASTSTTSAITHLKDNMMASTLRSIVLTADCMIPREAALSDEAFIALVLRVRGLQPQALKDLFSLPLSIPDSALDTSLLDLPVRVHRMMTWANAVEHVRSSTQPYT